MPDLENSKDKRYRSITMTLMNYTPEEEQRAIEFGKSKCEFLIIGYEIAPTTGTPHLQMYAEFKNGKTFSTIKEQFSNRLHLESRYGTAIEARNYCRGDDGSGTYTNRKGEVKSKNEKVLEFGQISQQGARTDWVGAIEKLKEHNIVEVIEDQPHLLPCINALTKFKSLVSKSSHRDIKVLYVWGKSGSGKTKWAWESYPDLYSKPEGMWWDGYNGEKTLLLDDFYGDTSGIDYSLMLKVLDRYPLSLPVKGGFTPALFTTVIITSNLPSSKMYRDGLRALKRRITQVTFLEGGEMSEDEIQGVAVVPIFGKFIFSF